MLFSNRVDAGRRLAQRLHRFRGQDVVVLGLPRGGVLVAFEVALELGAPLDVIVVRKLGVPFQQELGMGAIGEGGVRVLNPDVVRIANVSDADIDAVEQRERVELVRRADRFRRGRPRVPLEGRVALIIDDGIATGSTAKAACRVARALGAGRVVVAVPVAPTDWTTQLAADADELVCLETPENFFAVGQWYADFSQTTDDEVVGCLERAAACELGPSAPGRARAVSGAAMDDLMGIDREVSVHAGPVWLAGQLSVPEQAIGVAVFAHGSGSSRLSPRNRFVADVLNRAGIGTLLFDLLTLDEETDRRNVFDIELLAQRLADATIWLHAQPRARQLPFGYFGASTGAAAALWAATLEGIDVAAVVSRGGRPDLAGPRLSRVSVPTLLIVGSEDDAVLDLNRSAQAMLRCENHLAVVSGATHLFEEPGTLAKAAELSRDWFLHHLNAGGTGPKP